MRNRSSRQFQPSVDGLEARNLMAGSVVQSGPQVFITPDPALASNTTVLTSRVISGIPNLDVRFNGVDYLFSEDAHNGGVMQANYLGFGAGGAQLFEDDSNTYLVDCFALGGSGSNHFVGGSNGDYFFGGSGANTFDAGSGLCIMFGGSGSNVYNESATGWGMILSGAGSNTVNRPANATGTYWVF